MSDIIRLLKQSDPEPPVGRNAPLSPRARAELRSMVGLAADQGADKHARLVSCARPTVRRVPELLSVGLTSLTLVVVTVVAIIYVFSQINFESPTPIPVTSSSATPSESLGVTPSPSPPTPASSAASTSGSAPETSAASPPEPTPSPGPGHSESAEEAAARAAAEQAAADAAAEAARRAAEEAAQAAAAERAAAPCAVGLRCGAGDLYGSTWRVTYARGTSLSGRDTVQLGADALGGNRVSFIVGDNRCPLADTTNANMFVAQDNGAWDFGPGVQPAWQCEAPPDVPTDAYVQALRDLGQARSWYMPDANTVEFWANLANAVDRSQTQNLLVIFQR